MKRLFTLSLLVIISAYAIAQKQMLHLYGQIPKDIKGDTIKYDVKKGHLVLYHRNKEILIHKKRRQQSSTAIMWMPDKHNISLVWYRDGAVNDFYVKLSYKALNYFDRHTTCTCITFFINLLIYETNLRTGPKYYNRHPWSNNA